MKSIQNNIVFDVIINGQTAPKYVDDGTGDVYIKAVPGAIYMLKVKTLQKALVVITINGLSTVTGNIPKVLTDPVGYVVDPDDAEDYPLIIEGWEDWDNWEVGRETSGEKSTGGSEVTPFKFQDGGPKVGVLRCTVYFEGRRKGISSVHRVLEPITPSCVLTIHYATREYLVTKGLPLCPKFLEL